MISKAQEININYYRESKTSVRVAGYSSESKYARVNSMFFYHEEQIPIKFLDIFSRISRSAS